MLSGKRYALPTDLLSYRSSASYHRQDVIIYSGVFIISGQTCDYVAPATCLSSQTMIKHDIAVAWQNSRIFVSRFATTFNDGKITVTDRTVKAPAKLDRLEAQLHPLPDPMCAGSSVEIEVAGVQTVKQRLYLETL